MYSYKKMINGYKKMNQYRYTDNDVICIDYLFKDYPMKRKSMIKIISRAKEHQIPYASLYEYVESNLILGRDSSSLRASIIRYGEIGVEMFELKNKKCAFDKDIYIQKHGEEACSLLSDKKKQTKANHIKRYGEEEGKRTWAVYLGKRKKSYERKKLDNFSYPKYNRDYYIRLHGEEEGNIRYDKKINAQRYKVSLAYYIDQYGEEEGRRRCAATKNTISLESFIKRHGEEEGQKRYDIFVTKISFSNSLEGYIHHHGKESGMKRWAAKNKKIGNFKNRFSKISVELFTNLSKTLDGICYYGEGERRVNLNESIVEDYGMAFLYPDFIYKNKIIEFYGDYWHKNPKKYSIGDKGIGVRSVGDIWQRDMKRIEVLEEMGYDVMIVWELDYKSDKKLVFNECSEFLK